MPWMNAHYDGKCVACGAPVEEGDRILFDGDVYCAECGEDVCGFPDPEE